MLALLALRASIRPVAWLLLVTAPIVAIARLVLRAAGGHPTERTTVALNLAIGAAALIAGIAWLAQRLVWSDRRTARLPPSTTHGSAQWGTPPTAIRGNDAGLLIGRRGPGNGRLLRYAGDAHLLTLAPTGAGKGVGCVIPNLLTYPGPVLVTDPKGENFAVTAQRRRALGHRVLALDPYALVGGSDSFNPMDGLDPNGPTAVDDASALAELIMVREPHESGDSVFWSEEAKALLTGLILHAAADAAPERRTLSTVWEYLSLPPRAMTQLWTSMGHSTAAQGAIARSAARVRQKGDRVRSGILAQAQSQAHFLDSRHIARSLERSTFAFRDFTTSPLSLYLVLPPDRIDTCRRWMRLLVGCALHAVIRSGARRVAPSERVLFLLDEFPALGPMPPLERAVALARGYGVTCWLLAQDLSQLRALYPATWSTFVANAGIVQAFGTNDLETARYLSDMLGPATVQTTTTSRSRGESRGFFGRADCRDSWTTSERARALLSPDEVRRLDPRMALVLMPGADPMCVRRLNYLED